MQIQQRCYLCWRAFLQWSRSAIISPIRTSKRFLRQRFRTKFRYKFFDRRKNSHTLTVILAGYRFFIWNDVAEHIKLFAPEFADVCIASSDIYDELIAQTATPQFRVMYLQDWWRHNYYYAFIRSPDQANIDSFMIWFLWWCWTKIDDMAEKFHAGKFEYWVLNSFTRFILI